MSPHFLRDRVHAGFFGDALDAPIRFALKFPARIRFLRIPFANVLRPVFPRARHHHFKFRERKDRERSEIRPHAFDIDIHRPRSGYRFGRNYRKDHGNGLRIRSKIFRNSRLCETLAFLRVHQSVLTLLLNRRKPLNPLHQLRDTDRDQPHHVRLHMVRICENGERNTDGTGIFGNQYGHNGYNGVPEPHWTASFSFNKTTTIPATGYGNADDERHIRTWSGSSLMRCVLPARSKEIHFAREKFPLLKDHARIVARRLRRTALIECGQRTLANIRFRFGGFHYGRSLGRVRMVCRRML